MIGSLTAAAIALLSQSPAQPAATEGQAGPLPAQDWITMGVDCRVFAAGDVDGDGWADFLTINGNRDLCVARSINGWKAAAWQGIASDLDPEAVGMAVVGSPDPQQPAGAEVAVVEKARLVMLGGFADGKFARRREIKAPEGRSLARLDAAPAGIVVADDQGGLWRVEGEALVQAGPAEGQVHSNAADESEGSADAPAVGGESSVLSLAPPPYGADEASEVARLASGFAPEGGQATWSVFETPHPSRHRVVRMAVTQSPYEGDGDADGLPDAEEQALGTDARNRDTDADGLLDGWEVHGLPRKIDLGERIALYDPAVTDAAQREKQLSPMRQDVLVSVSYFDGIDIEAFRGHMPRIDGLYRALQNRNPDGSTGIRIHFIELPGVVPKEDQNQHWARIGQKYRPAEWRGLIHWMQVTPGGGGQSSETGDMGTCGNGWAVFAHELGHQMSLSHSGDSSPGLCPLYPSLMSYAYSYSFNGDGNAIHFSTGAFRDVVLDERSLSESLPFPYEQVKFLAGHPFRFTLKDNGDGTTLVDWNHNGTFDEGTVSADINYGYSTHAGDRKTHELVGSAASIAYVGETAVLAASDHKHTTLTLKAYQGDTKWSGLVGVPGSPTEFDPVLVGGPDAGALFFRRSTEWRIAPVTIAEGRPVVGDAAALAGLPLADLSAIRIGERFLVITRYDDNRLEARWLTLGEKPALSEPIPLNARSQTPVALAMNPADGTITMVGGAHHEKAGPFTMQLVSLAVEGDALSESAPEYTHEGRGNHCTSRPVAVYRGDGAQAQLTIFHTGWPAENGTWVGVRTMQVGNKSLSGGWLTCQMYDEWTRSRVAVAFADGPQGAIYAHRWDPGDHNDWKVNTMFVAHEGWGIDDRPMRDFDDAAKMSQWGIRHSILTMNP
jgi:hypothetical protein